MESRLKSLPIATTSTSPTVDHTLTARTVSCLSEVNADEWNACAGNTNPFLSHAFLYALEESGSCTAETGWLPQHLLLEDHDNELVGAMPMYVKGHSQGEYVFDHNWAHAYEKAGGHYYPKLQVSVPFTPATGPRLLVPPGKDQERNRRLLIRAATQTADKLGVSSLHVTFATKSEWTLMGDTGLLQRTGEQFHWKNAGYVNFNEFLENLTSRKRKSIRKERARALADGIEIETLTGDSLKTEHWDAFFNFYTDTGNRKWGIPYLTRAFFDLIHEHMRDSIALVMCQRNGRYIAGALNFIGADTLFGRHWGCIEERDCLHFEACYYRAIDFAIERGLRHVEAGAQGSHKIHRGYLPRLTYSAHWIRNEHFRQAVEAYLNQERDDVESHVDAIEFNYSPFRQTDEIRNT